MHRSAAGAGSGPKLLLLLISGGCGLAASVIVAAERWMPPIQQGAVRLLLQSGGLFRQPWITALTCPAALSAQWVASKYVDR
jgi:hypothetical protein